MSMIGINTIAIMLSVGGLLIHGISKLKMRAKEKKKVRIETERQKFHSQAARKQRAELLNKG